MSLDWTGWMEILLIIINGGSGINGVGGKFTKPWKQEEYKLDVGFLKLLFKQ